MGVQWSGKDAITEAHKKYPAMKLLPAEQECDYGKNVDTSKISILFTCKKLPFCIQLIWAYLFQFRVRPLNLNYCTNTWL